VSQENVEVEALVKRAYEALSRLDAEGLVALCEPDVEFRSSIADADDVTYRGHDGVREWIASLAEAFEWVRAEALEVRGEGDRAVVCNRIRARGRRSGVEVDQRFFQALGLRDGNLLSWVSFPSKAEALKSAGLQE
jgi:ketosteroid isomerase-like protein